MKKLLLWVTLAPIVAAVVVFAVANRGVVAVSLDPLPFEFSLPLYVVVMSAVLVGIVVGGLAAWPAASRARRRARKLRRELDQLQAERRQKPERLPARPTADAA